MTRAALLAALLLLPMAVRADPAALAAQAVESSPSLATLQARQEALARSAEVAGAWPDPVVSVEYSNVAITDPTLGSHAMAGVQLRASQTLRPAGISALQRSVGEQHAAAAGLEADEAAVQLTAAVHQTWWLLTRSRLLEANTAEHLVRAEELLSAARSRYETGTLGQHAVLRLEVLRDQLNDELADHARNEEALIAALTAALSADAGPYATPEAVAPLAPPADADWRALAEQHRPLLAALSAHREAEEQAAALAAREARPDLSVWAGYRIRTAASHSEVGTDLVSVGVGVPIPAGSARSADGAEAAAQARARARASEREAALDAVDAEAVTVLARWRRAADKAATHEQRLIPGAQAVLSTTRSDFSVGRADFASLFEAEVSLLSLERALILAATETWIQHAAALAVLGTSPLEAQP